MIDLIIQGPVDATCIEKYIDMYSSWVNEIIISSYECEYLEQLKNKNIQQVKIIYNDRNTYDYYNHQNLYLQASTTLNALEISTSDYCVKVRGDEFYSNLHKYTYNPEKLFTCNVFFSPDEKYHISDHIVGMTRIKFIDTMSRIIEKCKQNTYNLTISPNDSAEIKICKEYLHDVNTTYNTWNDIIKLYIDIAYIEELEPFKITFNSRNTIYTNAYQYYNSVHVLCNSDRGVKYKTRNVIFITHATLNAFYAYISLNRMLMHVDHVDTIFIYNTHEHEISNSCLIDMIHTFGKVHNIVIIPYDTNSVKTLVQDIFNISKFITSYPLDDGFTLFLKSDYIISKSLMNQWTNLIINPNTLWSLPIYNAKEKCVLDENIYMSLLPTFTHMKDSVYYRGGDNDTMPVNECSLTGYIDTDSEIRYVAHNFLHDYNVHIVSNDLFPKIMKSIMSADNTITWGGMHVLFYGLEALGVNFCKRTDAFAVHMFHDIISANRDGDRDDPRKCVNGERY